MCGRLTQDLDLYMLFRRLRLTATSPIPNPEPRYNGRPTQDFLVCREAPDGERSLAKLRWGLVPPWAKDRRIGSRLINARAETVREKPAFRTAFRRRRCLVPATGWFEWRRKGDQRLPFFITSESREPLLLAGLWERWTRDEEPLETFAIVTTRASLSLESIHDRQPAVLPEEKANAWLDPSVDDRRMLEAVQEPSDGPFAWWPVSLRVNHVRNDDAELLAPATP